LALGGVAELRGESEQSRQLVEEALQIRRQLEDPWSIAIVLNSLGQKARREGRLEEAQAIHEESYLLWRQSGTRMGERSALMNLAVITLERGDVVRSATLAHDSLLVSQEIADASAATVRCVEVASEVLHALGQADVAVRVIAAASARREELGAPVPPGELTERERTLSGARAALAADTFEQLWQDGGRLVIGDAVELAVAALAPTGSLRTGGTQAGAAT
jgi:hypothetical protein